MPNKQLHRTRTSGQVNLEIRRPEKQMADPMVAALLGCWHMVAPADGQVIGHRQWGQIYFSQRDAEITHVWLESDNPIHAPNLFRSLPSRLRPEETGETGIEVEVLPESILEDSFKLARVRLSDGRAIGSKENEDVPGDGSAPGR
jgi:hypothetical protein